MKLQDLRDQIDILDTKIVKLLNDRMEKSILAKKLKVEIEDTDRERDVLEKIKGNSKGLVDSEFCMRLYQDIMGESKRLQSIDYKTIAFQGEHGANSELACREWDSKVVPIPSGEFSEVLDVVESGICDYGMLPVENTSGGTVGPANNLLIYTNLHIISAVDMPISHCLMAPPGTDYREIRKVYSHPQALLQCRNFLSRAKLEPITYGDTAGAAKFMAEERPPACAAIANKLCAELYGLEIIKENIQDSNNNRTRFFILSKEEDPGDGEKTSIVFITENKAGALFRTLEVFAAAGINLTRIESVPYNPGDYAIFIDLVGSQRDKKVQEALGKVEKMTSTYRVLGSYKEKFVK